MGLSSLTYSVYAAAPVWLQNIAVSSLGLRIRRQRYGREFHAELSNAMARSCASHEEILAYQQAQWAQLIEPALAHVPAYANADVSFAGRAGLPVLRKQAIQGDTSGHRNAAWRAHQVIEAHTSGTTGAGLKFVTTAYADQRQWAYWWRYRMWHGIEMDEWCGVFGGREIVPAQQASGPLWRTNRPNRAVMFSQYHLNRDTARAYLEQMASSELRWLHGYPSILALLAKIGLQAGMAGRLNIKWITLGAENLLSHQAEQIEAFFGVKPLQHYGLAEGVANISECPEGRLHIDEDFSLIDLEPVAGRAGDFHLIGTTLSNAAMPLVRYDTGDIVRIDAAAAACSCGRPGRVVSDIDGRKEDYLVLADGSMVGRIDHLFKDATHVVEAQVVQHEPGKAVFRIVKSDSYTAEDESALRAEARLRFGDRVAIEFDYVDSIPRTATGKLRMVLNSIDSAKL